ncbi:alpha/beta fold hydrolase [uncultured Methylibium sp.]|uniref:alpha/beta fold hydrolase n=1 Tax=uncultured Methylibium sp. TaxID=381093 RepID=UPI0025E95062|nr:alpha/beta fold hydrolase [uncultured Methylibium sp.]
MRKHRAPAPRLLRVLVAAIALLALLLSAVLLLAEQLRSQRETQPAERLAPVGGRWINAGDASVFVQQWGPADGPMLLLVHGTGAWSGTWFELPDALAAAGWRVVAVDLPPFGLSHVAASPADYTRTAQARRLLAVVDALGGRDVVLVGHSFGAGPALEAALQDKTRLGRLVLVDPALGLGPAGEPPACEPEGTMDRVFAVGALRRTLVGGIATQPRFTPWLLSQFVHRKEAVDTARVPAYQRPMRRIDFSAGLADWALAFSRASCEPARSLDPKALAAWSAERKLPLRLIWGDQDSITPLAQAQALQRWLPDARLDVIAGVGHIPHIEAPEAFARTLLQAVAAPKAGAP